jgi:hypothetical protein
VEIIKEARRQLTEIMSVKRELATTLLHDDAAARRLAVFMGFHVSHNGDGAPAGTRDQRRRLNDMLERDGRHRIDMGHGVVVLAVGYHACA